MEPTGDGQDHERKRHCGGLRGKSFFAVFFDVVKFFLFGFLLLWLLAGGMEQLGYHWQWYRVPRYLLSLEDGRWIAGPLLRGLLVTLEITAVSLLCAFAVGLVTALFRLSGAPVARAAARVYLELIRNTPLLIQIFFIYFVVSPVLGWTPFFSAVLALSLFEGAYTSEIIRAGIVAIPQGQWEAARSLGIGPWGVYRHVILPQALRNTLPPLTGQAVSLIKDSALVSTIAIYDLTMEAQAIIADTFLTFEIWFTVAAVYLVLTLGFSSIAGLLEARLRPGG
ncbi:MAG TPA: amino acid ABC transporter permease [Syntrophales bacterium]|nr:amino acid ABC transporter permease [Syntrophales bacterium]